MSERKVVFSLRDLRESKGLTQAQVAKALDMSQSMYGHIETGKRKPTMDNLYVLSLIYKTSMDFIYHSFYRQHIIFHFPDEDLKYGMKEGKHRDIIFLRERVPPVSPPDIPEAIVFID